MKLFVIGFMFCSIFAFAKTSVYRDTNYIRATLNDENEAKTLYESMNIYVLNGKSSYAKVFRTNDEIAEIYCTKSKLPFGIQNSCTISINIKDKVKTTPVYDDDNGLHVSLNSDAKELYDALDLSTNNGKSGIVKVFTTSDEKAEIYCYKSSIPIGIPYGCTITFR